MVHGAEAWESANGGKRGEVSVNDQGMYSDWGELHEPLHSETRGWPKYRIVYAEFQARLDNKRACRANSSLPCSQ